MNGYVPIKGSRAIKSGLGWEIYLRINAKFDPEIAHQCLEWLRDSINGNLGPGEEPLDFLTDGDPYHFAKVLQDGLILARMANVIIPGSIPSSKLKRPPSLAFKQMELIELFIQKARDFGVPDHEVFQTVDLYEKQNLHQVTVCLQGLGRKAKAKGLKGFGPKEAEQNLRFFSEEQLRAGNAVIGLQMGTNTGANQAGMSYGKRRMIVD